MTREISWHDFRKVDMRVGRVIDVSDFPEAHNPSYKLVVDFGPLGTKKTSAAIEPYYAKEELIDRLVIAVVNFPPKQIANFMSEVLVLGAVQDDGRVILLQPDDDAGLGTRVA